MTSKIYIPALGAIVIILAVIAGIMIHRHDRRVEVREYYKTSNNQALVASCLALEREGISGNGLAGCPKTPNSKAGN